ncbi:MAG: hypothetical protein R2688_08295 [Fimbriimonadaceae bacterium]
MFRSKQWELWGRFIGTWLAFPLVLVAMNLPIIVGSAGMMLHGLLVYFLFPEKGFHKADTKTNSFEHMRETFRTGISVIRGKGGLIVAIMVVFMIGLSSSRLIGYGKTFWNSILSFQRCSDHKVLVDVPEFHGDASHRWIADLSPP